MRFYSRGDDALVYDEAVAACSTSSTVALTVPAGGSAELVSGVHPPWGIIGDSIPAGIYRVTAVLRITGQTPIELEAGLHNVQECDLTLFPVFTCRYVE